MQGNSHSFMNSYISWKASKKGIHVLHSGCTDQSAWVQLFPVLGAWADWLLFLGWSIRPEIPSSICSRWAGIICRSHRVMDSIMESILYPRLFFCNRNPVSRGINHRFWKSLKKYLSFGIPACDRDHAGSTSFRKKKTINLIYKLVINSQTNGHSFSSLAATFTTQQINS